MNKTLPLLLAGLLAASGVMAQSAGTGGAGDSSLNSQPGSSSSPMQNDAPANLPGTRGASSADSASSPATMGAGPSTTVVVPVVPVAVVPATPVVVDQPRFGRGNISSRAVDTGNGTIEGNGGPYDDAWWGPRPVYVYVPR